MRSIASLRLPNPADALPGRRERVQAPARHAALGSPLDAPFEGMQHAMFALGCFWGAERKFWRLPGVISTLVGYAGGHTPNPSYDEVCSGRTGHAEVVRVVFDQIVCDYDTLLRTFWESHDPTQGMRQGNDVGTQYRSIVFAFDAVQREAAELSRRRYQAALTAQAFGAITTEIREASQLYFAEPDHQQYLAKNPQGYCGLGGTGVSFPVDPSE